MIIKDIETIIKDFSLEHKISVILSCDMPVGYETAYGTYDVTINTLFLNAEILKGAPQYEVLFYLFHSCDTQFSTFVHRCLVKKYNKVDFTLCFITGYATSL